MTFNIVLAYAATLLCGGVAIFVFFKEKRSFVNLAFASGMLALALEAALNGLSFRELLPLDIAEWQVVRLIAAAFVPVCWLLFSLSFGRPDYRGIVKKWQWYILAFLFVPLGLTGFFRESVFSAIPVQGPNSNWAISLGWSGYAIYLVFLLESALIIRALEKTLRTSTGNIRWQIKFMVLGIGGIFAARIYTGSQVLLFHSVEAQLQIINSGALIVGTALVVYSLFRLRLLKIEIYPSASLLRGSITAVIVGIYLVAVGVLAKVADYFEISRFFLFEALLVFLACLGLAAILLSNRIRQEIKGFITVHLKRPKYDYRKLWMSFSHRTAQLAGIKEVCTAVTRMAAETFGVPGVTIWLLDDSREKLLLGGSTVVFSPAETRSLAGYDKATGEIIKAMRTREMPVDFSLADGDWAGVFKEANPGYFRNARIRCGVSLLSGNEFLGILTLDEKLTKEDFSVEDLELLKVIADQAAFNLVKIKMSQELSEAKEIEAFKTMSSFFFHDLKNLASNLSVTMENLPALYQNPEFRADALKAVSESLDKINQMCGGLSLLRHTITLHEVEADLNDLVISTLADFNGSKSRIVQDLKQLPRVNVDPEQIQKVVTNLILNARDAVANCGEIRVSTGRREGWVVLSVSDNGCGMSEEFIENSLFHPFKTTKKKGMGIGLYHSKMIVEAHHGRIEVQSEKGKGTTFRVFLPVAGKQGVGGRE
jgi:putative PEP-CTERM system histidine kinase